MDKLKPSQLLLLGASKVRHIRDAFHHIDRRHQVDAACAIGMMSVAKAGSTDYEDCKKALTLLERELCGLFITTHCARPQTVRAYVVYMNDTLKLSSDEIAERLEKCGY